MGFLDWLALRQRPSDVRKESPPWLHTVVQRTIEIAGRRHVRHENANGLHFMRFLHRPHGGGCSREGAATSFSAPVLENGKYAPMLAVRKCARKLGSVRKTAFVLYMPHSFRMGGRRQLTSVSFCHLGWVGR